METSSLPVLGYLAVVFAALLLPFIVRRSGLTTPAIAEGGGLAFILAGGAILLTLIRHGLMIDGMILLILSALGLGLRALAGALVAALLFAATTWWPAERDILPVQYHLAAGACLVVALFARKCLFDTLEPGKTGGLTMGEAVALVALLIVGLTSGLLTGASNARATGDALWHHWSAYVSPVNAMLAGGVPFRDFPVQYGMGPTVLTAVACASECWSGLYRITLACNALFLAINGWSVLLLTRGMDRAARMLSLLAMASAIVVWLGYPTDWGGAIISPSAGGLRFLPLAMMTALILTAEESASQRLPRKLTAAGHAIWLLGLAWSPEAGFFSSLLWWPWLALRRADVLETGKSAWAALLRGGLLGTGAVMAGYGALAVLFRAVFGQWVAVDDFLLYLLNPPGRETINGFGPIWYLAAVLLLGMIALWRTPDGAARRTLYVCLLAALAATSYFVSRAFDNNLFNLLSALIILMLAIQARRPTEFGAGFLRASLTAIIALPVAFQFHSFAPLPGASSLAGMQVGPAPLIARFTATPGQQAQLVAQDAARAIADLRAINAGQVLLVDRKMVMPTARPGETWSGVNNTANFIPLPPDVIRRYVRAGAKQFQRSGWLVTRNEEAGQWLDLFAAAYDLAEHRSFGSYTAWRLVPRNEP